MANLSMTCPHCKVQNTAFYSVGSTTKKQVNPNQMPIKQYVMFACNACNEIVTVVYLSNERNDIHQLPHHVGNYPFIMTFDSWPKPDEPNLPPYIPEAAGDAYLEAETAMNTGIYTGAAIMYRKALELGIKDFSNEPKKQDLMLRIDRLHTEGRITDALKDWAHTLRIHANDFAHDEPTATKEEAEQLQDFCYHIMLYLYTMPKQVELARERRNKSA